jgi:ribosomal-protein-alanine N-acetyltransferase
MRLVPLKITPSLAELLNSPLYTSRLTIEPLTRNHAGSMFSLMQDRSIYEWISSLPPEDLSKFAAVLEKRETRLSPDENEAWLNWAVKRSSDGAYVGKLDAVVDSENIATNVGYVFFPAYWGKGYATEAVLALSEYLEAQGVLKLIASVTLGNIASYRVLEKCGYKKARIIPENDLIRGKKFDDVEYIRVTKK